MSQEFRGFSPTDKVNLKLYDQFRLVDECRLFCFTIVTRLGQRIAASRWHSGSDQRGGRDYFFDNAEIRIRGRKDPSFFGFFHYRTPERFAGSHWQVWEWEHDDDPVISIPLPDLIARVDAARASGRLPDLLDEYVTEIKRELGLH